MASNEDVKTSSRISLCISTTYIIANFEPAENGQDKMEVVCEKHAYVEESIASGNNNGSIDKEAQTTTSSLGDQTMDDVEDDSITEPCRRVTPQLVPVKAASQYPDLGRPQFRNLREQLMCCETNNYGDDVVTDRPLDTSNHLANDRKGGRPSEHCGNFDQSQKPPVTSDEEVEAVTLSAPLCSFPADEQRATSTLASSTTLNSGLSSRADTPVPVPVEAALDPFLPKRCVLAPKTGIQGASFEEPIVIDAFGDDQKEKDSSEMKQRKRSIASSGIRSRPQRADGVIMWSDPEVEEGFLNKTRAIWYHIQSQWMEVRQLPGLEGMLSVVQYNNLINAIASSPVENDVLAHDDVTMLRDRYKRVEDQALSKLSSRSDQDLVRNLGRYINRLHDESLMVKLITDHPMKDDKEDVDYRPAKRRRS